MVGRRSARVKQVEGSTGNEDTAKVTAEDKNLESALAEEEVVIEEEDMEGVTEEGDVEKKVTDEDHGNENAAVIEEDIETVNAENGNQEAESEKTKEDAKIDQVEDQKEEECKSKTEEAADEDAKEVKTVKIDGDKSEEDNVCLKDLLTCQICPEVCSRAVIVPCCYTQACRVCATKKVLTTKKCWACPNDMKTDDLINDDSLRNAVARYKAGEPVVGEDLIKLKNRYESNQKKPVFLESKITLEPMQNSFETRNTKIYMSVEALKTRKYVSLIQVGCLNATTGDTLLVPFSPTKSWKDDDKLLTKCHLSEDRCDPTQSYKDTFLYSTEEGMQIACALQIEGLQQIVKFITCAAADKESSVTLVFYTKQEKIQFINNFNNKKNKSPAEQLMRWVENVVIYETAMEIKEVQPLTSLLAIDQSPPYSAHKFAGLVREAFVVASANATLDDLPTEELFVAVPKEDLPLGMCIISSVKTDTSAFFDLKKTVDKGQKKNGG